MMLGRWVEAGPCGELGFYNKRAGNQERVFPDTYFEKITQAVPGNTDRNGGQIGKEENQSGCREIR